MAALTAAPRRASGRRAFWRAGWRRAVARGIFLLAIAALALCGNAARAQAGEDAVSVEQRVKAAFLYQFAGYAEWPADAFAQPDSPIVIAVMGADTLAAALTQIAQGRTMSGRTVTVRRVRAADPLTGVHILFVGRAEAAQLAQLVQRPRPRPILVVTESDKALGGGSMINFVIADQRVRFEVALDTVEQNGLRLSSRLLALATEVRTGGAR
jgi:hypothetical protein